MAVTYTYLDSAQAQQTRDFDTIVEAVAAACADFRSTETDKPTPVSVDDHEGNFYDDAALRRSCMGRLSDD